MSRFEAVNSQVVSHADTSFPLLKRDLIITLIHTRRLLFFCRKSIDREKDRV